MSGAVAEIGRQVEQSMPIASQATSEAERANSTVQSLATAAQRIGEVVGLINAIASQTNPPALNATIEAARAGEAASQVLRASGELARESEILPGKVDSFLSNVQAA